MLSKKICVPMDSLESEVKAMEEGVHFAWNVGIRDIIAWNVTG